MRRRRTDRLALKKKVDELERENETLRLCVGGKNGREANADEAADAPVLLRGGYPVLAAPFTAKSLDEAKRIIISGDR